MWSIFQWFYNDQAINSIKWNHQLMIEHLHVHFVQWWSMMLIVAMFFLRCWFDCYLKMIETSIFFVLRCKHKQLVCFVFSLCKMSHNDIDRCDILYGQHLWTTNEKYNRLVIDKRKSNTLPFNKSIRSLSSSGFK